MKKILFVFVCLCTLTANAQKRVTTTEVPFEDTQARMLDVQTNVHFKPLVVELKMVTNPTVVNKPTGNSTVNILSGGKTVGHFELTENKWLSLDQDPANVRSWATFQLTQVLNCDVIVAATYDVQYDFNAHRGEVVIYGFPAVFDKWRTMDEKIDLQWIREENEKKSEFDKVKPVIAPETPSKR